jgi:hypothetical protein
VTIAVGWPDRKVWWRNLTGAGGRFAFSFKAKSCEGTPSLLEMQAATPWSACGSSLEADIPFAADATPTEACLFSRNGAARTALVQRCWERDRRP